MVDPPPSNACNTQSKNALKFNEKDYVVLQTRAGGLAGCWRRAVRTFDLDLLREPRMLSLQVGLAAVYSAGVSFNILLPFFLATTVGLPRADVALCMSLMAGSDISARLLLPLLTDRLHVPARHTFLLGAVVLAAARSLMALQRSLMGVLVSGAFCGFVRAANVINLNLAVSESVSPEKLPGALGLNMVIKGISITVLGLFTGWLRDRTGSFTICMHMLSLLVVLPMLAWLLEMWLTARRRRFRQAAPQATTPPPSPPPSPPPPPRTPPPTPTSERETSPLGR